MNDDLWGALSVTVGFFLGFWNGWMWREILTHRRLRQRRRVDGVEEA